MYHASGPQQNRSIETKVKGQLRCSIATRTDSFAFSYSYTHYRARTLTQKAAMNVDDDQDEFGDTSFLENLDVDQVVENRRQSLEQEEGRVGIVGQEPQHQDEFGDTSFLVNLDVDQLVEDRRQSLEPISKRQKLANEQQRSLLIDQPDSFLKFVVSFWDFQSLLAFRQTNHRFKRIAEEDLKRRSLEALPVDCDDGDCDGERSDGASLRIAWSEKFRNRDAVYEYALTHADPGGAVSLDADYDEDKARDIIHSTGCVDVGDFLGNSDSDSDADEAPTEEDFYLLEVGWRVSASFRSISPKNKWNNAKALLINEEGKSLQQCAFGLLLDAQPSSLRYACAKMTTVTQTTRPVETKRLCCSLRQTALKFN
jgi:hypothetical protein